MSTKILLFAFTFLLGNVLFAVSPNQTIAEHSLKDNRYFLEFINVCVSNFGNENDKKMFQEAYQLNFNAHLWYLQSDFSKSFINIRKSQEILRDLYLKILQDNYLEDARKLLDISAPIIIAAKDKKAEMFLRLGYRDLEAARQFKEIGFNYNRFLFSNKIRHYMDGIKRARRAKRFAFLALIESKTPMEDKEDYQTQTIEEALKLNLAEDIKITDYEKVRNKLINMLNRRLFENTYNFFLHHDDNYGLINEKKQNVMRLAATKVTTDQVSPTPENTKDQKKEPQPKNQNQSLPNTNQQK
ncbi:MAG: hypothetical protein D6767_10120 [Candidatus Hydrogenedentota bacterium]|nr:MAG: hypothetical protein D6767_10120 [Candidatus Hydrogenedentota bacterium]